MPGERVLLKVSDHHLHLGKMNDRYDGPFFVITVFDTGVIRVKEEARPDRPPKMVHHDRVRRFEQEAPFETPRWVTDAIASFSRRANSATQTEREREVTENTSAKSNRVASPKRCVFCKHTRHDKFGLVRTFDKNSRCHLCYNITTVSSANADVMNDAFDCDLFHL